MRIRNELQLLDFAKPTCELFPDAPASSKSTKRRRRSAAKIKELRQQPAIVIMTVPGFDGKHPLDVRTLRPVNPRDDITGLMDAETLDHVFGFIRHSGITPESLMKRPYKSFEEPVPKGIWRRGDMFCVQVGGKYRRARTLEDAVQLATALAIDDGEPADDGQNIEDADPMAIADVDSS